MAKCTSVYLNSGCAVASHLPSRASVALALALNTIRPRCCYRWHSAATPLCQVAVSGPAASRSQRLEIIAFFGPPAIFSVPELWTASASRCTEKDPAMLPDRHGMPTTKERVGACCGAGFHDFYPAPSIRYLFCYTLYRSDKNAPRGLFRCLPHTASTRLTFQPHRALSQTSYLGRKI